MSSNDSVIRDIYKSCSNYAADYVINSYRTSLISNYNYVEIDNTYKIKSTKDTYYINSLLSTCTCLSSSNMILPCKHIFFLRRIKNLNIFDIEMIPIRWQNSVYNEKTSNDLTDIPNFQQTIIIPNLNSVNSINKNSQKDSTQPKPTQNSRFSKAHRFLQELAGTFINDNESEYNDKIQLLLTIKEMWENNVQFEIKPIYEKELQLEITSYATTEPEIEIETEPETIKETEIIENIPVLAGKKLLKAKSRGRPLNRKNNKDIDTTQQTPQQLNEQRLITNNKLLSLVVIDKRIIPQVLENKCLIQESEVLVVFDKMYASKQKILDEFKENLSMLQKYFDADALGQLSNLINI